MLNRVGVGLTDVDRLEWLRRAPAAQAADPRRPSVMTGRTDSSGTTDGSIRLPSGERMSDCVRNLAFRSLVASLCLGGLLPAAAAFVSEPPRWESDVQPVLAERCSKCHGASVQKAALDLSSLAGLQAGGESGEALTGETADDALLWAMIDGEAMPPEGEPPLTDSERDVIRRWLDAGAPADQSLQPADRAVNQHDVSPILLLRCAPCHGAQRQDAELDLRTAAAIRAGGRSGPVIVPGDADASPLIRRIESQQCPPAQLLLKFFVRRPDAHEVDTLRAWIDGGAMVADIEPDVATRQPDPLVTDSDRQHWAFRPPQKPAGAHSIDAFVQRKLAGRELSFAPEADRDTLIRRAWLTLTGLPPEPEAWSRWKHDERPDWFPRLVDTLLESPRYGERWGRYWLDIAGYADSEGGVSADPVRDVAWKYRDYVIDAFNEDRPWDQFLLQQLAGDELVDFRSRSEITDDIVTNLTATGFLRMGIDQTGSRTMNFVPERLGVINDAIAVVGSGVMGLTLECARCHSHKYDPIPQRDYYRFKAIFQGAFDEHDWLTFRNRSLDVATDEHRAAVRAENPERQAELKRLSRELRGAEAERDTELLRHHHPELTEDDRAATLAALKIADNTRTQPQRVLVEKLQRARLQPDGQQPAVVREIRDRIEALEQQIRSARRGMVAPTEIRALWDRGRPSPTYILVRGEHNRPGKLVGPGVPSVLTDGRTPFEVTPPFPDGTPTTGRRLALAKWLTRADHPLTARVLVNRIWHRHFGRGLVKTLDNFGIQGASPTHPELLDWLAVEFVENGWSLKALHRRIMNSRTWRQSSVISDAARARDPDNRWLSRMPMRRMDAETLRDSLLFVAGRLDLQPGGPPDDVRVDGNGRVSVIPRESGNWRRSVYAQFRRTEMPTMMETFDYPEMGPNCVERSVSTVALQSLLLSNSEQVRELAASLAERVGQRRPADDVDGRVMEVYRTALSREPDARERESGIESLERLTELWQGDRDAALATWCHVILNSADFIYID